MNAAVDLRPARFVLSAGAVAFAAAVFVVTAGALYGPTALRFGLLGWALTTTVGVFGGAWLIAHHGKALSPFLIAMATCMLARAVVAGAGALVAVPWGIEAMVPYVGGLLAGYLPVQILEMVWFHRRSRIEP